jgi:5'-3' exonuclease
MIALIDADIVNYRIGFTTELEDVGIARWRCDEMVKGILTDVNATEYKLYLSDNKENNFRFALCPKYKANRKQAKPKWHEEIKEHLVKEWDACFAYGMEADDALGIAQTSFGKESVICSIDKDLRQIAGNHYNFVKKEYYEISEREGLRYFYAQLLIGDVSDNISGCRGIGPIKAEKSLPTHYNGGAELFRTVFGLYRKIHKDWSELDILNHLLLIGRLLKIKTKEDEPLWHFPEGSLTEEQQLLFTASTQETKNIPSTEPIGVEKNTDG